MPHPRLQVEIELEAPEIASDVRSRIEAQVGPRPKVNGRVEALSAEENTVRLDVRFLERIDRGAIKQWLRDQIVDHPEFSDHILAVRITEHLCTHDEDNPKPCDKSEFRVILDRGTAQVGRQLSRRVSPK